MRRALAALAVVLLAGGAWIAYTERWNHGGAKPVAWRDLPNAFGAVRLSKPTFLRLRTQQELGRFASRAGVKTAPPVDFSREMLLVAATGARSSSGYAFHIESISEQRSRIVVRVRETTPSLGQPVAARVTFPYLAATIPRSDKRVHWIWLGRP